MQALEVEKVNTVVSTCCYFDANIVCENGLEMPDSALCAKCVADAYAEWAAV